MEVEIDETRLYVRKYHERRLTAVEEWALGGVYRQTGECFVYTVSSRNSRTLCGIIENIVTKRSHILTDRWGGYRKLNTLG